MRAFVLCSICCKSSIQPVESHLYCRRGDRAATNRHTPHGQPWQRKSRTSRGVHFCLHIKFGKVELEDEAVVEVRVRVLESNSSLLRIFLRPGLHHL